MIYPILGVDKLKKLGGAHCQALRPPSVTHHPEVEGLDVETPTTAASAPVTGSAFFHEAAAFLERRVTTQSPVTEQEAHGSVTYQIQILDFCVSNSGPNAKRHLESCLGRRERNTALFDSR